MADQGGDILSRLDRLAADLEQLRDEVKKGGFAAALLARQALVGRTFKTPNGIAGSDAHGWWTYARVEAVGTGGDVLRTEFEVSDEGFPRVGRAASLSFHLEDWIEVDDVEFADAITAVRNAITAWAMKAIGLIDAS